MSGDVQLAHPARRLTPAPVPGEVTAWRRSFPLFEAYFAVAGCGSIALVVGSGGEPVPARAGAAALLALIAVWYLAFGRRIMLEETDGWPGWVYLAVAAVLFVPAVALVSIATYALFVLSPHAFMVLRFWPATAAAGALNAVPSIVALARTGDVRAVLTGSLPIALLTTAVTAFLAASTVRMLSITDRQRALIVELESTRAEVARLSHEAGVAAERQRLAGDLHDTIAQGLSTVVMLVQAADAELTRSPEAARRHLDLAGRTAREHMAEVRSLVAALMPGALAGSSLPDALHRLAGRFSEETGVAARVEVVGDSCPVPTAVEVMLLRAMQEALANVRKHAGAKEVGVRLAFEAAAVSLQVRDDGRGLVPGQDTQGYGLSAMRFRVEQVGGVLTIESDPGVGTVLRVEVPR